jgi:hypothetical protein
MPLAAPSAALLVSSDRCAEASYPVIVYWVRIAAIGSTKISQPKPLSPLDIPVLLTVVANTSLKLACRLGSRIRMRMTAAAPTTCHHTEMLLMTANRWLEKMLMIADSARMTTNMANTLVRL